MKNLLNADIGTYKQLVWRPSVDIYENTQGWLIKIELAGVSSEDIDISIMGENLIIRGCRRDYTLQSGQKLYSMEIAYTRFQRVINIPCNCDCNIEKITMIKDFKDGMLLIRLVKEKKK